MRGRHQCYIYIYVDGIVIISHRFSKSTFGANKGSFQKLLSGFFPLFGKMIFRFPPTPLTENHFAKKILAERGGTSPPPLTENCRKFSSKNGSKRAKIGGFWPKIAVF